MAEATDNLSYKERLAITRYRSAVLVLAHQSARKAVKAQFRAQGIKLNDVSARTISIMADAWFDAHREDHISKQMHRKRMSQNQPLRLCRCQVQNDCGICTNINGWPDA
jgi:hypothetical protein